TVVGESDFSGQRNVAPLGSAELPVHFEMAHQILPAIAGANVTDGPASKSRAAASHQVNIFTLCMHQCAGADLRTTPGITRAVRRDQCVKPQLPTQRFIEYFDLGMHDQD